MAEAAPDRLWLRRAGRDSLLSPGEIGHPRAAHVRGHPSRALGLPRSRFDAKEEARNQARPRLGEITVVAQALPPAVSTLVSRPAESTAPPWSALAACPRSLQQQLPLAGILRERCCSLKLRTGFV